MLERELRRAERGLPARPPAGVALAAYSADERRGENLRTVERGGGRGGGRRRRRLCRLRLLSAEPALRCSPARAAALCAAVPAGVQRVGLFVDADDAAIDAVLDRGAARHPAVPRPAKAPSAWPTSRRRFGRTVMKAIAVAGPDDVAAAVALRGRRRLLAVRRQAAAPRRRAAGRQRARLRLAADRRARVAAAVDAVGRPDRRAAARGGADFRRHGGRCLLRRRAPSGRQGPRQDPRFPCRSRRGL